MLELLQTVYFAFGLITVAAYIPNIIQMLKTDHTESSLVSWIIWWLSSCTSIMYGIFILHDRMFTIISAGHFCGTLTVIIIQILKRKRLDKTDQV